MEKPGESVSSWDEQPDAVRSGMAWSLNKVRRDATAEDPHRRVHAWSVAHALGLVASLEGATRAGLAAQAEVLDAGVAPPLILVPARGEAWLDGRRVAHFRRSRLQYRLLEAIAIHGTSWDHQALYQAVWGLPWRSPHTDNALHSAIARVRRSLDAAAIAVEVGPLGGFRLVPSRPVVRWREDGIGYPPPPPPPPRPAPVRLGAPPPALWGRDTLVGQVEGHLNAARWISLLGPPGVGKTVLARTVLHRAAAERWPGGRLWIDAADVRSPTALIGRVRADLGAAPGPLLVVLDNLEQLDGNPAPLDDLLDARPGLVVVATSRRTLHLTAERPVEVGPLSESDGLELLAARLIELGATLPARRTLVDLTRAVQHMPLALEQVAQQVASVGAPSVLRALQPIATEPPEIVLDLAIGRSWALLDQAARSALEHLALYPMGLTAAELGELVGASVEATAEALAAHHLVSQEGCDPVRYVVYISVQSWVIAALQRDGRLDAVARAQVAWAHRKVQGEGAAAYRLDAHGWRNIDAALDRALRHTHEDLGDLLSFVVDALLHHSDPATTRDRSDRVLSEAGDRVALQDRSRVYRLRGLHLQLAHHHDQARAQYARALATAEAADDDAVRFEAHRLLANLEGRFDLTRGLAHLAQAQALVPADAFHQARYENLAAEVHRLAGDLNAAVRAARRCIRLRRARGEVWTTWTAVHQLAHALTWAGRLTEARQTLAPVPFEGAAPRYRANWAAHHALLECRAGELDDALRWLDRARTEAAAVDLGTQHLTLRQVEIRVEQGDVDGAAGPLERSWRTYRKNSDATGLICCASLGARRALDLGDPRQARQALDRGRAARRATGVVLWPGELEWLDALTQLVEGASVATVGSALDEVVAHARGAGSLGVAARADVSRAAVAVLAGKRVDLEPLRASVALLGDRRLPALLDVLEDVAFHRSSGGEAAVEALLDELEEGPDPLTARSFLGRFWLDRLGATGPADR